MLHADIVMKAFTTYVRYILEYSTPVWSPHTVCNINKIESCKRWFTKRIKGLLLPPPMEKTQQPRPLFMSISAPVYCGHTVERQSNFLHVN